jgi:hypothetical protein
MLSHRASYLNWQQLLRLEIGKVERVAGSQNNRVHFDECAVFETNAVLFVSDHITLNTRVTQAQVFSGQNVRGG